MQEKILRKIMMQCPICEKSHLVEEWEFESHVVIKDEEVVFNELRYICPEYEDKENNSFVSAKMMDDNLLRARNAYKKNKGLLTSSDIATIREKYSLSQSDLSLLMGWGEVTVNRYETKAIQDQTYDNLLRLIDQNPLQALEFLEKSKEKFNLNKYNVIKENITKNIVKEGSEHYNQLALITEYTQYQDKIDYTGNQKLDTKKLVNAINYFAAHDGCLYKVKLMKLLWYADFLCYKKYGHSMFGLVYQHKPMGALPIGHNLLLELNGVKYIEEYSSNFDYSSYKIEPSAEFQITIFNKGEIDILSKVVSKFKNYSGQQLAEYMHKEIAYTSTSDGDIILYSYAKEIFDF